MSVKIHGTRLLIMALKITVGAKLKLKKITTVKLGYNEQLGTDQICSL